MPDKKELNKSEVLQRYISAEEFEESVISRVADRLPQVKKIDAKLGYDEGIAKAVKSALGRMENISVISPDSEDDVIKVLLNEADTLVAPIANVHVAESQITNESFETDYLASVETLFKAWPMSSTKKIDWVDLYCRNKQAPRLLLQCKIPVWSGAVKPANEIALILGDARRLEYVAKIDDSVEEFEGRFKEYFHISTQREQDGIHVGKRGTGVFVVSSRKEHLADLDQDDLVDRIKRILEKDAFFAYKDDALVTVSAPGLFSSNLSSVKFHGQGIVAGMSCLGWWQSFTDNKRSTHRNKRLISSI